MIPVKGMKTEPMGLPLMFEAWFGCVIWCASQEGFRGQFTEATGLDLQGVLKASPIEKMIDRATGYEQKVLAAFCDFVTEAVWGKEGAEDEPTEPIVIVQQSEPQFDPFALLAADVLLTNRFTGTNAATFTPDPPLPPSFVQGIKDCDEGRTVDMERALTEEPPTNIAPAPDLEPESPQETPQAPVEAPIEVEALDAERG